MMRKCVKRFLFSIPCQEPLSCITATRSACRICQCRRASSTAASTCAANSIGLRQACSAMILIPFSISRAPSSGSRSGLMERQAHLVHLSQKRNRQTTPRRLPFEELLGSFGRIAAISQMRAEFHRLEAGAEEDGVLAIALGNRIHAFEYHLHPFRFLYLPKKVELH